MTWTDPLLTEGDPWHGVGFLNDLVRAINERQEAGGAGSVQADFSEGDIVQGVSVISGLQAAALTVLTGFQDPDTMDVTPGSIPSTFTDAADWHGSRYTNQTAMDAAGLSDGFTRKRPREITALGDAGSDGQIARYVGGSGDSKIYTHNGTTWSLAADQSLKPDVVEVDSTFPRYIQEGDYIGPWIFNELQDLLQVAEVVVYGGINAVLEVEDVTSESDDVRSADSDGFKATAALATAAADADWPTGDELFGSDRPAKFSAIDQSGSNYRAWAFSRIRTYTSTRPTGTYSYTQTAELVALPRAYGHFGTTYEDFGQGMVEDDLYLFDSGDFDNGDELVMGGSTDQPTWEDSTDGVEGWGWHMGSAIEFRPVIVSRFTWEFG